MEVKNDQHFTKSNVLETKSKVLVEQLNNMEFISKEDNLNKRHGYDPAINKLKTNVKDIEYNDIMRGIIYEYTDNLYNKLVTKDMDEFNTRFINQLKSGKFQTFLTNETYDYNSQYQNKDNIEHLYNNDVCFSDNYSNLNKAFYLQPYNGVDFRKIHKDNDGGKQLETELDRFINFRKLSEKLRYVTNTPYVDNNQEMNGEISAQEEELKDSPEVLEMNTKTNDNNLEGNKKSMVRKIIESNNAMLKICKEMIEMIAKNQKSIEMLEV